MFSLHQTISHSVSSSGVSVQSRSRLKAMKTPPWASPTLPFRMATKESGKISEFFYIRGYPRLIPQDDVWFCRVDNRMNFSLFILDRLTVVLYGRYTRKCTLHFVCSICTARCPTSVGQNFHQRLVGVLFTGCARVS